MSACKVDLKRSVKAVVPPETRGRIREVLYQDYQSSGELAEVLHNLPRRGETASVVYWDERFYVAVSYGGDRVVWKVRPSSVRSVLAPSLNLRVEARLYCEVTTRVDNPGHSETTINPEGYERTLCKKIRAEMTPRSDSDREESPILVVTVENQGYVLTRERVIGTFRADSILVV
jgi:hypothetical protein